MNHHKVKVILLDYPRFPMGTLYRVWEQSRSNDHLLSPAEYESEVSADTELGKKIKETCRMLLSEAVPVTENLNFVFEIQNVSISLREQMVRHRIGARIGDLTGIDIIPELAQSSWWSQTTRVVKLDKLFDDGRYIIPDSLHGKGDESETSINLYKGLMKEIQEVYKKLLEAGVPVEDARQVIPVGATHGITWSINLKAMIHILGKRACWIAQLGLWEDLMVGMVDELCRKVNPMFRQIIQPPCMKNGKYNACPIKMINLERIEGRDGMPPCPLFIANETGEAYNHAKSSCIEDKATWIPPTPDLAVVEWIEIGSDIRNWKTTKPDERVMLELNIEKFRKLWKIDMMTGEPIQ